MFYCLGCNVFTWCACLFVAVVLVFFFLFKQKTAYEWRIRDWSSDVCSSDRQIENVRTEYARGLRAEPVYQTLRATAMVEECEDAAPADGGEPRRGLAKVVGAVKDALTPNSDEAEPE